jgi:hypothetical protein
MQTSPPAWKIRQPLPVASQMVASLSACEKIDSEALVHCLQGKSEDEILAITKVTLYGVRLGWDVGEEVNRMWGNQSLLLYTSYLFLIACLLILGCKMETKGG